ncbi:hypothetical protein SAMN05444064_103260 [Pseudomonas syringae]|uniref:DUF7683 domain-containing protein n=1 Tax=Pseudomonas syringae TaxID=317 RepID=UPI000895E409|nr:hypothetical protein [Pseudomonas syringae]SDW41839.1 hypothetical protein SAMN05444514_103260 [Pseudomonas syringae]SFL69489.1 hypothetical protein SAMN05444064_103260 [Pseudomonas syringae]
MKYLLEAFDKNTELLAFERELPDGIDEKIKRIMNWSSEQQGIEGYNLSAYQLSAIARMLGEESFSPDYDYQLSCNL